MGGGGQSSSTQSSGSSYQHGEFKYPEWYTRAGEENYAKGKGITERPYEAYDASVIPEFSQETSDTLKWMLNNVQGGSSYLDMYDEAGNKIRDLIARGDVKAGNVKDYMNPYVDTVVDRSIDNAERSGRIAQRGITQDATNKRAFGGSRQAIQQAVQGAETTRGIGDLSAKLYSDAYDKGTEAQRADWGRQFSNIKGQEALANDQIGAAKAAQAGLANDYFQMLSAGKMKEDKEREKLEETYKKFLEKRDWDKNQLTWLAGLLGITPVNHTEDIWKTESSNSNSKSKGSSDIGGMISGGGSILTALLGASDRDLKTNIEKLGTDPATELPVYAYDYKADVKGKKVTGPKRVGYMAQDVEKKYPKAVKKVSGKRVIDFSQLPLG
jgi:hypothetical protein